MELFLGLGQFAAALAVAVFTWKLARYTRELVRAQEASNRVLERQAELMDKQCELMEKQTEVAERQAEIQHQLAQAEVRPLLAVQAVRPRRNGKRDGRSIEVTNLGKYGALLVKVKQHHQDPNSADSPGRPLMGGRQTALPHPPPAWRK